MTEIIQLRESGRTVNSRAIQSKKIMEIVRSLRSRIDTKRASAQDTIMMAIVHKVSTSMDKNIVDRDIATVMERQHVKENIRRARR